MGVLKPIRLALSEVWVSQFQIRRFHSMLEEFKSLSLEEPEVELSSLLQKLELGPDADIEELTAKMKTCKVKWSKKAKLAYNKQKVECSVCGKVLNRGGISYHKSSSRHKKALRKLKRKEPSGSRGKAGGKTRKSRK